jgi:hypothetical protein
MNWYCQPLWSLTVISVMLVAVRQEAWNLVLKLLHHQPVIQIVPIFHNHLYIFFTVLPTTVYSFHSDATIKCVGCLFLTLYSLTG